MKNITINQPKKLVLGEGSLVQLADELKAHHAIRIFILIDPHVSGVVLPVFETLHSIKEIQTYESSGSEPSFSDFEGLITLARAHHTEMVIGIGGGSVLDLAKLVAALVKGSEEVSEYVGAGLIGERKTPLICVPTTSGAGSESSPNAILIDDKDNSKKGIIDAALIPDAVYIDPMLMVSLPPAITAFTGLDALTHCIEAYANRFAHPLVDVYALEGIRLISQNLARAIANGNDLEARQNIALGAYYGGMCLGPVNTAAVHALAYPLGTRYKIAHGLSNALLLPFVLEFNLESALHRYADIALAMGGSQQATQHDTAFQGIILIRKLISECGMPARLSELDIAPNSVHDMASEAMLIQRLLKNNVREVGHEDAVSIYQNAF